MLASVLVVVALAGGDSVSASAWAESVKQRVKNIRTAEQIISEIRDTTSIGLPFDAVWKRLVVSLVDRRYAFEVVDRPSGLVVTKPVPIESSEIDKIAIETLHPLAVWRRGEVSLTILVIDLGNRCVVRVRPKITALESRVGGQWIEIPTNGELERDMFRALAN